MLIQGPITFISDVHNAIHNIPPLSKGNLICLGDIVDMFDRELNANTIDYFRTTNILSIRGNHDRTVSNSTNLSADRRQYLAKLPLTITLETDFGKVLLWHACAISDDTFIPSNLPEDKFKRMFKVSDDIKFVLCGHLHKQATMHYPNGMVLGCVGTLVQGHYAILDANGITHHKL